MRALADTAAGHRNSPRINYLLHCAGCHLADGAGKPDRGIPDMRGQIGHYLRTPDGRAYLAQVPGVANSALSNREIAAAPRRRPPARPTPRPRSRRCARACRPTSRPSARA